MTLFAYALQKRERERKKGRDRDTKSINRDYAGTHIVLQDNKRSRKENVGMPETCHLAPHL